MTDSAFPWLHMWWRHAECDRAAVADRCEPCRLWAEGRLSDAQWSAAAAEAEED